LKLQVTGTDLQHTPATDKEVHSTFAVTFFQDFKMMPFLKTKLFSVMKPWLNSQEMLLDIA
jgi:hypothetical protein